MVQPQLHQRNMNVDGDSAAAGAAFLADGAAAVGGDRPEDKFTDKKQTTHKNIFSTISRARFYRKYCIHREIACQVYLVFFNLDQWQRVFCLLLV